MNMYNSFHGKLSFCLAMTSLAHCYSRIRARRMVFHLQMSQGRRGSGWALVLGLSSAGSDS